jgi:hypothetical protein
MDGNPYPDDVTDVLSSPEYDFSDFGSETLFLSFHFYSATEGGFDGVNLWAAGDAEEELLLPLDGYTDLTLAGLAQDPGWSGDSDDWRGTVCDISHLIGQRFRLQWRFGSDSGINGAGFFLDGITFDGGETVTAVAGEESSLPAGRSALAAFPNPFNPNVTIAWSVDRAGPLRLEVYDLQGRKLRTIHAGPVAAGSGQHVWDGRDGAGRALASGVYLVKLTAPDGSAAVRRIVLAK